MIPNQRSLFDLPDDVAYLNCAYLTPQLRAVTAAGREGLAAKEHPWNVVPDDFFTPAEAVRERFGRVIGADPDGVALIPSVSYGISVAAANVSIRAGQTVVVLAEQFPSNIYPWWRVAELTGADLVTVPRPTGAWTPAILDAIDGRTAVVAVPECHWTDGSLVDLVAVGEATRGAGAALVVDASQSAGARRLDVDTVRPDFLITVGYKWLLGPYRTGYLWAAEDQRAGVPIEFGWLPREGSSDFSRLVDYTTSFQPGARRYDVGEFGDFIAMPMLRAALDQLLDWGLDEITATLGAINATVEEEAAALGLDPAPEATRVAHMMGVRFPDGVPPGLMEDLQKARVYVSMRGDSMRVAPHLFTTDADVDRLLDVVASAL